MLQTGRRRALRNKRHLCYTRMRCSSRRLRFDHYRLLSVLILDDDCHNRRHTRCRFPPLRGGSVMAPVWLSSTNFSPDSDR